VTDTTQPFWLKPLAELDHEEWEALCDGCARCCLHKVEDEDGGKVHVTRIACRLLDLQHCRCRSYGDRQQRVPDCLDLASAPTGPYGWLPITCAYRLRAEGKPLAWWHHLVSGSRQTVHEAGISVRGKVLSERHVHPDSWDEHIIDWVELE